VQEGAPVHRLSTQSPLKKTLAFVAASTKLLKGTCRGIVFVMTKSNRRELQKTLQGVDFVSSDIEDLNKRDDMVQRWKMGESGGWIIGTSSLIQGVDYPNVHLVVFMGLTYGMVDFMQGAGRAGRNGEASQVILVQTSLLPSTKHADGLGCAVEMAAWMENGRCAGGWVSPDAWMVKKRLARPSQVPSSVTFVRGRRTPFSNSASMTQAPPMDMSDFSGSHRHPQKSIWPGHQHNWRFLPFDPSLLVRRSYSPETERRTFERAGMFPN